MEIRDTAIDHHRFGDGCFVLCGFSAEELKAAHAQLAKGAVPTTQSCLKSFVQLRLKVQKDGSVTNIEMLQGDSRLVDAARQAVSQWHYEPFKNCGQPIEKELTVVVGFDPS